MADELKTVAPGCPLDTYGEVPEWLIKEVRAQIDAIIGIHFGGRYSNQKTLKRNGRIEALEWVLSLRKPENK